MNTHDVMLMAVPALIALFGGVVAAMWNPSAVMRSLFQHFAAGVVLAAIAVELLPEISRDHAPPSWTIAAFAAGSLFMYGLKLFTERLESRGGHDATRLNAGLLAATFIDVVMDGFIIGAGFAAGGETGMILALGLAVELLFLGLALASEATRGWRIIAITGALGLTVLGAALAGSLLLSGQPKPVIGAVLAFSAAALLYLVTEELLIEAHTVEEKPYFTLVLFAGFLVFWAIQLYGTAGEAAATLPAMLPAH